MKSESASGSRAGECYFAPATAQLEALTVAMVKMIVAEKIYFKLDQVKVVSMKLHPLPCVDGSKGLFGSGEML